jgi:hypothetical protein
MSPVVLVTTRHPRAKTASTLLFMSRVRHNQQSAKLSLRVKRRIDGLKQSRVAEWLEQALDRALFE